MKSYRLEFNPDSECPWHIEEEPGTHQPNTNGWQTVVAGVPDLDAMQAFTEYIDWQRDCNNYMRFDYSFENIEQRFWDFKSGWDHRHTHVKELCNGWPLAYIPIKQFVN